METVVEEKPLSLATSRMVITEDLTINQMENTNTRRLCSFTDLCVPERLLTPKPSSKSTAAKLR